MPLRRCTPAPPPSPRLSVRPAAIAAVYPRLPATAAAGPGPIATPGARAARRGSGVPSARSRPLCGVPGSPQQRDLPPAGSCGFGVPPWHPSARRKGLEAEGGRWWVLCGGSPKHAGLCDPTRRSLCANPNRSASPPSNRINQGENCFFPT